MTASWAQQVPSNLGEEKVILAATSVDEDRCIVLCLFRGEFVTWSRTEEGYDYSGHYHFQDLSSALEDYNDRAGIVVEEDI